VGGAVQRNKTGYERREFPRFELPEGQVSAVLSIGGSQPARTIVRDISLGGVKLDAPAHIPDSTGAGICVVRFTGQNSYVRPATARGRLRRVDEHEGRHDFSIEFAEPLESVGTLALST